MTDKIIETLVTIATLDASQFVAESKKLEAEKAKTAQRIEKGAESGDKKEKQRATEKSKRERKEAQQQRRDAQERERSNEDLKDQLIGIGRTAATMFLGFESIKGAINAFNNYTTNTAQMGRGAANLGQSTKEFQTMGQAVKLAGGDAASAEAQFAQMQQSIFALMTQGQTSPLVNTFRTMGVYIRDAQGNVRGLTDLLSDLATKMEKRGLNRAQQFQWLQAAGINGDVANLLLDKNRDKFFNQAAATSTVTDAQTQRSQEMQNRRENLKNKIGSIGNTVGDAVTQTILGTTLDDSAEAAMSDMFTRTPDAQRGAAKSKSPWKSNLEAAGKEHGIPDNIMSAVAFQESRFRPGETNAKSGATGIMQLTPQNFPGAGKDPAKDIETAATELERLFKVFASWPLALAAYNDGQGDVSSLLKTGHRSKKGHEGETSLPEETQNYVRSIYGDATPEIARISGGGNQTHSVTTGDITIKTNASSLSGVGEDFAAAIRRKSTVSQANTGMT